MQAFLCFPSEFEIELGFSTNDDQLTTTKGLSEIITNASQPDGFTTEFHIFHAINIYQFDAASQSNYRDQPLGYIQDRAAEQSLEQATTATTQW